MKRHPRRPRFQFRDVLGIVGLSMAIGGFGAPFATAYLLRLLSGGHIREGWGFVGLCAWSAIILETVALIMGLCAMQTLLGKGAVGLATLFWGAICCVSAPGCFPPRRR